MFDLIKTTGAEHVIFLTGDQHYAEVARNRGALDYDAIELQFASVNQIETPEKNIHRVSTVASSKHSFAWLDLHLDETDYDQPYVNFTVKSHESGETEVFYRVNLSEIDRDFALTGNERFVDQTTISLSTEFDHLIPRAVFYSGADASKIDELADPSSQSLSLQERNTFNDSGIVKVALFDFEGNRRSQVQSMQLTKLRPMNPLEMSRKDLKQGVNFRYVEGEFEDIPDFDQAQIIDSGIALDWDVEAMAGREDHYAFEFTGYLHVQEEGVYTFSTRSDDGSRLYIHDDLVVENGGSHSIRVRTGQIALKPGLHPIRLEYFEDYMGQHLEVGIGVNQTDLKPLTPLDLLRR
jgi:hypothetical protein